MTRKYVYEAPPNSLGFDVVRRMSDWRITAATNMHFIKIIPNCEAHYVKQLLLVTRHSFVP